MLCEICNGENQGNSKVRMLIDPKDEKMNGKLICDACWDWSIRALKNIENFVKNKS